jgi:cell division protein FtsW (lipid II flippase)
MDKKDKAVKAGAGLGYLAPEALEWLFTLAAIAFLVWQSGAFRDPGLIRGAGDRYQEAVELKAPILPQAAGTGRVVEICTQFGGWLPQTEREISAERTGACYSDSRHPITATATGQIDRAVIAGLTKAHEALVQSLALPVKARLSRLDELENRAREARAETDVQGANESLASETRLYRDAYGIAAVGSRSIPLECAWNYLEAKYHAPAHANAPEADRVFALLSLAALLDGDSMRTSAAAFPVKEVKGDTWSRAERDTGCAALGLPRQVIASAAEIVAKARASETNAAKSLAARELLSNAHRYFALWAVAGLLLLQIGRQAVPAYRFLPLAALLWAVLGWISQVHIEWISDRSTQTAWLMSWGIKSPDFFQVLIAGAALLLILGVMLPLSRGPSLPPGGGPSPALPERQTPSSRIGYAGFVLFVGLGWWLSLDLSATGHYANRFHALYQQVYVFAAFVLLTMLSPMRLQLADKLGRWFGLFLLLARPRGAGLRRYLPWAIYATTVAMVLLATGASHKHQTQFTSEIFRLWLVFGVSWFFFVRGESALSLSAGSVKSGLRGLVFVWPLIFVLCVPLFGLMLTDDFGPLFVMLYAASIFLGAAFAFAFFYRAGYRKWLGGAVGVLVAGTWVYLVTFALYSLPAPLARIAERLASVRSPFTATNDQMAIITWFQESAPSGGYGLGAVPWCGEIVGASCRGVPRQIQSDYVFTALVGVYGRGIAVMLVAMLALWLVRVVIHHSRATRGIVALDSAAGTQQAWLSWIAVCWVGLTLAQLAITVAGNLGWLPLTGITFPFASFGAWSLLANTFFLSLAISLPRKT